MNIISWSRLAAYAKANPKASVPLLRWRVIVRAAKWSSMDDVHRLAPGAKVLNAERVRFEIGGGRYRLIAAIHFGSQAVFVKFIGTHAEYDKIDALTVSQF
jgi:mRNA interferase HigB